MTEKLGLAVIDGKVAQTTPDTMLRMITLAVGLLALSGCSDSCTNTPLSRMDALETRSAVMFQRDCGATTGFSTQISVVAKGDEPTGGGNTFVADDDHGAATVGHWGGPWAEMRLLGPNHLLVRYAAKSRIFKQVDEVAGIKVSYQQVTR